MSFPERQPSGVTIAKLREKVTIQVETKTPDTQGGSTISWVNLSNGTVRASVLPLSAGQIAFSMAQQHRITHKVTVRRSSDVSEAVLTGDMRILFGTRILHVRGFRNLGLRNRFIELSAEEGTGVAS